MKFLQSISIIGCALGVMLIPVVLLEGFVSGSLVIKGGPISLQKSPAEFWITTGLYILLLVFSLIIVTVRVRAVVKQSGSRFNRGVLVAAIKSLVEDEVT